MLIVMVCLGCAFHVGVNTHVHALHVRDSCVYLHVCGPVFVCVFMPFCLHVSVHVRGDTRLHHQLCVCVDPCLILRLLDECLCACLRV